MRQVPAIAGGIPLLLYVALPTPAVAADPEYQAYLFDVCAAASGALATRCSETAGGVGDVSGDSESSLNPSQNLSHTLSSGSLAQQRVTEARERAENVREEEAAEPSAPGAPGRNSLLVHARAARFERDRNPLADEERGLDGDAWGVEIGLDRRVSNRAFLGALLAFDRSSYDFDAELPGVNFVPASTAGDGDVDAQSLTLYAVINSSERTFVDASLGYGIQQHTFRRNSVFQNAQREGQFDVRTAGDTDGEVFWAALNGGLDFARGASTFGPYAGLTYTRSTLDAYTERDLNASGLNMSFGKVTTESLLGHAGLRADRAFSAAGGVLVPQLRVEYLHEFRDDAPDVVADYALNAGASVLALSGDEPDSSTVSIGAGLTAYRPNGWIVFLNFDSLTGGDLDRDRVTLGFRVEF